MCWCFSSDMLFLASCSCEQVGCKTLTFINQNCQMDKTIILFMLAFFKISFSSAHSFLHKNITQHSIPHIIMHSILDTDLICVGFTNNNTTNSYILLQCIFMFIKQKQWGKIISPRLQRDMNKLKLFCCFAEDILRAPCPPPYHRRSRCRTQTVPWPYIGCCQKAPPQAGVALFFHPLS